MSLSLPIDDVLPAIRKALADGVRLVLAAPPGAGKTTRLPLALIDERWLGGARILLLEPRRIAARLAAERMASTLGEKVGETIGLSTRIDRRVSAATRIEVVTDGLTARRIIADPELHGVGAVLFDEFHERSLALDLGLALALDIQGALRPDLRLIVMSATLDTARIAARLSPGDTRAMAGSIRSRLSISARCRRAHRGADRARGPPRAARERRFGARFLAGAGEILRTAERLGDIDAMLAPLYGALSPAEQDAAVAPAPIGHRKVVLATDIAESSLTIAGVSVVIDAGLARVAES